MRSPLCSSTGPKWCGRVGTGRSVATTHHLGRRSLWTRTNVSAEQLVADLQTWCHKAEQSGIVALQEFSLKLRAAHA